MAKEIWSTLVQTTLKGHVREFYASMELEDAKDYDKVKQLILKSYE